MYVARSCSPVAHSRVACSHREQRSCEQGEHESAAKLGHNSAMLHARTEKQSASMVTLLRDVTMPPIVFDLTNNCHSSSRINFDRTQYGIRQCAKFGGSIVVGRGDEGSNGSGTRGE